MRIAVPRWKVLLAAGAGIVFAVLLVVCWLGDRLFYYPDDRTYADPADYGVTAEDVYFAAPGGPRLHGWWLVPAGEWRGTVVYCHGNAANVTLHTGNVQWLPARGYAVLVFDYRGFGKSEGTVTRAGTVADAIAAIDFALDRDPNRTVLFGHSLGGAVGVAAVAERPAVRAVVAESTFPNYLELARSKAPWLGWLASLCISRGYDPDGVLDRLGRPLLVVHGEDDDIVPVAFGRALYERAAGPKELWLVPGNDHHSPWWSLGEAFEQRIDAFFQAAIQSSRGR